MAVAVGCVGCRVNSHASLSRVFPRSFHARLLSVVLVCMLLPMLCLVAWLLDNNGADPARLLVGSVAGLAVTVAGTLASLYLIGRLLQPLRRATDLLEQYRIDNHLPAASDLGAANDEVGRLLHGIHRCLEDANEGLRELERHATEDPLTHAMNRRGAELALEASVVDAAATGSGFTLFVADLDNLKTINDAAGHAAGDRALLWLVDSARQCCVGEGDWIARWGGDEFLLGLHADSVVALDRVKVWMQVLESAAGDAPAVYASIGAASLEAGVDASTLYQRADAAMYRAKFAGGGRIVVHPTGDGAAMRTASAANLHSA